MNIALVFPRIRSKSGDPPLGLGYLASNVPEGRRGDVTIVDGTFMRSLDELLARLSAARPDLAGIYFDTMNYDTGVRIARRLKEEGVFVLAGAGALMYALMVLLGGVLDREDVALIKEAFRP